MADEQTPAAAPAEQAPAQASTEGVDRVQFQGEVTGNEAPAEQAPAPERPEGLPEGFDSWEAFGKAQLEKQAQTETPAAEPTPLDQAISQLPEATREKATPFFEEFAQTGDLSDEAVKKAAAEFGFTEDMVRDYVAGAKARNAQAAADMMAPFYEVSGGADQFDAFSQWARSGGMTEAAITQLEAAMNTKDGPSQLKAAVEEWRKAGHAPAPRDIAAETENKTPAPAVQGYRSRAEMTAAMSDPRYATDEAYRKDVEAKVAASTAF